MIEFQFCHCAREVCAILFASNSAADTLPHFVAKNVGRLTAIAALAVELAEKAT